MFDVDFCEKMNKIKSEICAILKNSSVENDKREDFDDIINFDIIFAQNICFFDVTRNVANKINSMRFFDEIENEISDEVTNDFENFCENMTNNASSLNINDTSFLNVDFASFVANFF